MQIRHIKDQSLLRRFLLEDRALGVYALGDLVPSMWELSSFYGAFVEETLYGISLVWNGGIPPVYVLLGTPTAAQALVQFPDLPSEIFYMVPTALRDAVEMRYELLGRNTLWRMIVTPASFEAAPPHPRLRRLRGDDVTQVQTLLTEGHQDGQNELIVSPSRLDRDVFFGIVDEQGTLVAMAGSHVYAPEEKVGVIGFVYTQPQCRGRGYATIVTSAVTQAFFEAEIDLVALNVGQDNSAAIRAYEKLGYVRYTTIGEGMARQRL